eukprot:SAG22_NODE_3606_length_1618_cov_11.886768_2_plen_184_part_00
MADLTALGAAVSVEQDAGRPAGFTDDLYEAAGASVVPVDINAPASSVWMSDLVIKVQGPTPDEAVALEDRHLLSKTPEWFLIPSLVKQGATVASMTLLIRSMYNEDLVDYASSKQLGNAATKLLTARMRSEDNKYQLDTADDMLAQICLVHARERLDPVMVDPPLCAETVRARKLSHFVRSFA